MPLFVVMTNLPGPGAAALLDEILTTSDAGDGWRRDEDGKVWVSLDAAKTIVDGASEFVELETESGASVGPSSGVDWGPYPGDTTKCHRLGPLEPPITGERLKAVEQTLANVGAPTHDEHGRGLSANGRLVDWLAGKRSPGWVGTEGEMIDALRRTLADVIAHVDAWNAQLEQGGAVAGQEREWDAVERHLRDAINRAREMVPA